MRLGNMCFVHYVRAECMYDSETRFIHIYVSYLTILFPLNKKIRKTWILWYVCLGFIFVLYMIFLAVIY